MAEGSELSEKKKSLTLHAIQSSHPHGISCMPPARGTLFSSFLLLLLLIGLLCKYGGRIIKGYKNACTCTCAVQVDVPRPSA